MPREQLELFIAMINASADTCRFLIRYLDTGSVDDLTRATNALLFQSSMRTKAEFSTMLGAMTRGVNPLTDAQRAQAKEALQHGDA